MLPVDFVERMKNQISDSDDFFAAYERPYFKSLRINSHKNPTAIFPGSISYNEETINASRVSWEKKGIYYYENGDEPVDDFIAVDSPGKSPLHAAGAYYIQEASAMIPVTKLDLSDRGLKVLDLCAAPGGKTTQIGDYMGGKGLLVANEIIPSRAKILSENIERMGVTNALVISEDPHKVATIFPHFFDRILVDAPCSGEGMFRKHNEAMDEWSPENVDICAKRQADILDCAVNMLAVGGKIVYSTCTFSPEEDEKCIDLFLQKYPQFARAQEDERIFPHRDKGEGHFAAVLCYKDDLDKVKNQETMDVSEVNQKDKKKNKKGKKTEARNILGKEDRNVLFNFCSKHLKDCDFLGIDTTSVVEGDFPQDIAERLFVFGERIFLAPVDMPELRGVTVLRPGLALGKVIKGRFEPDHALALALRKNQFTRVADFAQDSREIHDYLRGGTISIDGENGWYLICTEGISVGWGKCTNGCVKNHYPKGLRIQG